MEEEPEILHRALHKPILNVKAIDMGEPKALLGVCLTPPPVERIELAILNLKEVGTYKWK